MYSRPVPTFKKLINAQQHYLQISYTEFHPKLHDKCGTYKDKFIYALK
jgi:hypothetical protein